MFGSIILLVMIALIAAQMATGKVVDRRLTIWAVRSESPGKFWVIILLQAAIVVFFAVGMFLSR